MLPMESDFEKPNLDSADRSASERSLLLCPISPDRAPAFQGFGGPVLHPASRLRRSGQQFILSWDFFTDECGIQPRASIPISQAFVRLGAVTFPLLGHWNQFVSGGNETRTWLVKIPWSYRLQKLLFGVGGLGAGMIRAICSTRADVLCEHQLDCWGQRYGGFLVITQDPLNEETWTWNEVRCFLPGEVDRDGVLSRWRPIAIAIPGDDADYLWIWCSNESTARFQQGLCDACRSANLQLRLVKIAEM
jgi:hypothetical protein